MSSTRPMMPPSRNRKLRSPVAPAAGLTHKAWGQILNLELFHPLSAATGIACTDRNRDGGHACQGKRERCYGTLPITLCHGDIIERRYLLKKPTKGSAWSTRI